MTPILLDTVIGIVILLSTLVAFFRGFVREVLTIANLAGASAAAYFFGPMLKPKMLEWLNPASDAVVAEGAKKSGGLLGSVPPDVSSMFLSYAAVFFIVFIILSLAGMAISGAVKGLGLGPVDKVLGMFFGAARGFLIVFLFYLPIGFFVKDTAKLPTWASDSFSVSFLDKGYHWMDEYLNKDTEDKKEAVQSALDKTEEKVQEKIEETTDILKDESKINP